MKIEKKRPVTFQLCLVLSLAGAGCRTQAVVQPPAERNVCADYASFGASLAEETVNCTGTIGPQSFMIDGNGYLQNRFAGCTVGADDAERNAKFDNVKRLLRFQNFGDALPKFRECLTDRYKRWTELFARTKLNTCPNWTLRTVVGDPSSEGKDRALVAARQHGKMQPKFRYIPAVPAGTDPKTPFLAKPDPKGISVSQLKGPTPDVGPSPDQRFADIRVSTKSVAIYDITFPTPEANCEDPAVCAAQCAAFLPGFVVAASGSQVAADPAQWYRSRVFALGCQVPLHDDPWCAPDYAHQMSVNSTTEGGTVPPGDRYGHPIRGIYGEHCLKWFPPTDVHPGFDYETDLVLECTDPAQTDCLSRCGN